MALLNPQNPENGWDAWDYSNAILQALQELNRSIQDDGYDDFLTPLDRVLVADETWELQVPQGERWVLNSVTCLPSATSTVTIRSGGRIRWIANFTAVGSIGAGQGISFAPGEKLTVNLAAGISAELFLLIKSQPVPGYTPQETQGGGEF